jgi:cycloeucalenol cycloisomerase
MSIGKEESVWLPRNRSKRSGELFQVVWSVLWIGFFGFVVVSKVYEEWRDTGYMLCGLALSIPNLLLPNLFPSKADKDLPWLSRFVTKSWVWIAIFNFIANYFFTQYFFVLLGCEYSFPITYKLNGVPIPLYLITQSYFMTYFSLSNFMMRKLSHSFNGIYFNISFISLSIYSLFLINYPTSP